MKATQRIQELETVNRKPQTRRSLMRMSMLFSQTIREVPAEAETAGHQLLLRAGFIRKLASGIFTYMPFAKRSLNKIENIMRDEMNAIGGQEISMPVVHPAEIWKETKRWFEIGSEMGRFKDKNQRDMVLAMTHEEAVADLVRKEIQTYKQMPILIYHIQIKWRDDPRPRAGLIRVREFTMKDSYSLDIDEAGLDKQYRAHYQSYFNIFNRCGLPVVSVKSDVGMMGGQLAHEFMYLAPIGEDTLIICDSCGYSANRQVATFRKKEAEAETPLEIEKIATPGVKTIDDLAAFLKIPAAKTAKAVFMMASFAGDKKDKLVLCIVRGDMELNETKLTNIIKATDLRPATDEEIEAAGAVAGYASPVGLKGLFVVMDDIIETSPNLIAGANQEGFHLKNVNYKRDFNASIVTDIAAVQEGDGCPSCGKPIRTSRGVETGNIFKLGTRYSQKMGCNFLDKDGKEKPVVMGSYGIGSGRLLGCLAEEHYDDKGLVLPISVAPFQVHMVRLPGKGGDNDVIAVSEQIYKELNDAGIEVLFDDRTESPGVKFNDADLIGLPIRLTVSKRSLEKGVVEFKLRTSKDFTTVARDEVVARVQDQIAKLTAAIAETVVEVPFDG
jgi:prolyl-tRNA synthetase